MASQGRAASRYAKALFQILQASKGSDAVLRELESFEKAVTTHKDLGLVLQSPVFTDGQRTEVVKDVVEKMALSPDAARILTALSGLGRISALSLILKRLRVLLLQSAGIQPISVATAETLSADEKKHIEEKFSRILGKGVEATYESHPSLVGGLRVTAGGRTFDGTVSGWLATLQESMVQGEV